MKSRRSPGWRPVGLRWAGARMAPAILLWLMAWAGYFGPWAPHRGAGLVITGVDLAEYVKFLPEVMAGQAPIQREAFYMPLISASLIASLLASRRVLPPWLRLLLGAAAVPLALAMLPPAWSPGTLRQPEFRIQVLAMLACLSLLPLAIVLRYLPDRLIMPAVALLALAAALWPAWSFLQVLPAIEDVYRTAIRPGLGFWVGLVAWVLLAIYGSARTLVIR